MNKWLNIFKIANTTHENNVFIKYEDCQSNSTLESSACTSSWTYRLKNGWAYDMTAKLDCNGINIIYIWYRSGFMKLNLCKILLYGIQFCLMQAKKIAKSLPLPLPSTAHLSNLQTLESMKS